MTNSWRTHIAQFMFGPTITRNSTMESSGTVFAGVTIRPGVPSHVAGVSSVRGMMTTRSRFCGYAPCGALTSAPNRYTPAGSCNCVYTYESGVPL